MPTYRITDPATGKTLRITGPQPPNEAQLKEMFARAQPQPTAQPAPQPATNDGTLRASIGERMEAQGQPRTFLGRTINPDVAAGLSEIDQTERSRRLAGANIIPRVTGAAGGLMAGVPGAAAGGAIGSALQQTVRREEGVKSPSTAGAQAKAIAFEAGLEAAFEGVGRTLASGAAKAGRWFMNRALNPPTRLSREFPELSQTMIDNAILVSKGGLDKARQLLKGAKEIANAAVKQADEAGAVISSQSVKEGLGTTLDKIIAESGDKVGDLKRLAGVEQRITKSYGDTLTIAEADRLKGWLQRKARSFYTQARGPNGRPALEVVGQGYADMASALNSIIERATTEAGAPGYKAANATVQELIGVTRGIQHAIRPGSTLYQAMVRPGVGFALGGSYGYSQGGAPQALAGAAAGTYMLSPRGMSHQARVLTSPIVQFLLREGPRLTGATATSLIRKPAEGQAESR